MTEFQEIQPAATQERSERKIAIRLRGVSKNFGAGEEVVHALKNIDLDVYFGELVMIVGPSGCGKTTLLSVIAGTLAFDSGDIEVFGVDLKKLDSEALTEFRAHNVGFIFQQFHLIPTLTSVENISIPLLILGHSRISAFDQASTLMTNIGLSEKTDCLPKELAGGQQQRVAIARALIHEPRLVICDEPTSALDYETGAKIMDLLKEAVQNPNRAVIVVTHDHRIFKYAERIIEMDDGAITTVKLSNLLGKVD